MNKTYDEIQETMSDVICLFNSMYTEILVLREKNEQLRKQLGDKYDK